MAQTDRDEIFFRHAAITTSRSYYGEEIRIAFVEASPPQPSNVQNGTIVLVHGFPQTSYQFRHVMHPLARAGYRVFAPDYTGAGGSSKPVTGYSKRRMATDLADWLGRVVDKAEKIHLVGHDIGGMIAHAFVQRYPERVKSLIWGECPLPGTGSFNEGFGTIEQFHFVFHAHPDLAVALVSGRERIYLEYFFRRLAYNTAAITDEDLDIYVNAYSQPGALRAAFLTYAAFAEDSRDNQEFLSDHGKIRTPTLILSGDRSRHKVVAADMAREMYDNVEVAEVESAGHYIAEENAVDFCKKVLEFIDGHNG